MKRPTPMPEEPLFNRVFSPPCQCDPTVGAFCHGSVRIYIASMSGSSMLRFFALKLMPIKVTGRLSAL